MLAEYEAECERVEQMTGKGLITHRYAEYLFNPGNAGYKAVIQCEETIYSHLGSSNLILRSIILNLA